MEKGTCRVCNSSSLYSIIDFGDQPISSKFHEDSKIAQLRYPLELMLCEECFHNQLSATVPPEIIYTDYLSFRGDTESSKTYFDKLSGYIDSLCPDKGDTRTVLDIGCNDGTGLDAFSRRNWQTYGVDPARNLYEITSAKSGHIVIRDFWSTSVARGLQEQISLRSKANTVDVITVINILSHVDDLVDFMEGCKMLMSSTTRLYMQLGQANMILNRNFDAINHEHLSYFTIRSFDRLVTDHGMRITNLIMQSIYGGSYLFEVVLNDSDIKRIIDLENHIETETVNYKLSKYQEFGSEINKIITNITNTIEKYRSSGFTIIGYGAYNKANSIINLVNMELNYILDENDNKVGLYTPNSNIKILPREYLEQDQSENILIVILAWNWATEIKDKLRYKKTKNNQNTKTILTLQYFPEIKITTIFTTH
jgi:SAM-dependent methyltransferase